MELGTLALLYLGSQGFSALSKGWAAEKQRRESRRALKRLSRSYLKKSPYEQEWLDMLRKRMKEGALPTREMMQQVSRRVGEEGAVARQRAVGYAASRGLEHSGVAASMAGKVDARTLRAIAEQARAIAIQNEMTKTSAEREFGQYALGESDIIRQLAKMKYDAGETIRGQHYGTLQGVTKDIENLPMEYARMKYYYGGNQTGTEQELILEDEEGNLRQYIPGVGWIVRGK